MGESHTARAFRLDPIRPAAVVLDAEWRDGLALLGSASINNELQQLLNPRRPPESAWAL